MRERKRERERDEIAVVQFLEENERQLKAVG
jgi:hypothetical protein